MVSEFRISVLAGVVVLIAGCGALRVDIVGDAMAPTLRNGESALATRSFDQLDRGDIVGFRYPRDESMSFVQRIVGLPGESIQMLEGQVLIDGQVLDEKYVALGNRSNDSWGPIAIAAGHYFMMGDNRGNSSDSRSWGTVRRDAIWAKMIDR
jgi:signal peptidase I